MFDLKDNIPVITVEGLHVPEMRAIWEADKSPEKHKASGALIYVYFMAAYKSVYDQIEIDDRKKILRKDFIKEDWFPEELISAAINKHKFLHETEMMRLVQSGINACRQLRIYLDDVDFKERDNNGRPIYLAKDVATTLKQIGGILSSLEELKEQVRKGVSAKRKIKRNVKPSSIL